MQDLCKRRKILNSPSLRLMAITAVSFFMLAEATGGFLFAKEGYASWYSVYSVTVKEKLSGIMANGEVFDDEEMVCASWDYPFGTYLKVTHVATQKAVVVIVKDRGPAKRLYKKGRIIDLSKRAFSEIADLKQGLIPVKVEVINE